jgi:hypothetical protein
MVNTPRIHFESAKARWWGKPLVRAGDRALPAELAVLALQLAPGERGTWLNSRGTSSGVVDIVPDTASASGFRTRRVPLPPFVTATLRLLYRHSRLAKGCPDLVIWSANAMRLVEVKCPHWDAPSIEQERFMRTATRQGVATTVVEWEFANGGKGVS